MKPTVLTYTCTENYLGRNVERTTHVRLTFHMNTVKIDEALQDKTDEELNVLNAIEIRKVLDAFTAWEDIIEENSQDNKDHEEPYDK